MIEIVWWDYILDCMIEIVCLKSPAWWSTDWKLYGWSMHVLVWSDQMINRTDHTYNYYIELQVIIENCMIKIRQTANKELRKLYDHIKILWLIDRPHIDLQVVIEIVWPFDRPHIKNRASRMIRSKSYVGIVWLIITIWQTAHKEFRKSYDQIKSVLTIHPNK